MSESVQDNRYASIDFLKVFLCVGIIFRHAELVALAGRDQAFDVMNQMGMLFTELFVPMFFILSGFLFFRNAPKQFEIRFFTGKWKSRLVSLLVPYVIANIVAFVCYWLAYKYFPSMVDGFFGDSWKNPLFVFWTGPVNLSLWFIRDLIIAVLCAPLTWLLVRYTRIWGVLALGLVFYFVGMRPWCNFFFALGAWAAMWGQDVKTWCVKTGPWWLLVYICTFAAAMQFPELKKLTLLSGFPLLLYAVEGVTGKIRVNVGSKWAAWCFFLYLYHYIPELALKKYLGNCLDPHTTVGLLLTFLAVALLTLLLVSGLYVIMKKLVPGLTKVLVGGKL